MKQSPRGLSARHNSNPGNEVITTVTLNQHLTAQKQSSMPKVYEGKLKVEKSSMVDNETPSFMDTMIVNKLGTQALDSGAKDGEDEIMYHSNDQIDQ